MVSPDESGAMARHTSPAHSPRVDTTVVVRFWPYGDLWNGVAIDLPIVVLGVTLDDVRVQLGNALVRYLAVHG